MKKYVQPPRDTNQPDKTTPSHPRTLPPRAAVICLNLKVC